MALPFHTVDSSTPKSILKGLIARKKQTTQPEDHQKGKTNSTKVTGKPNSSLPLKQDEKEMLSNRRSMDNPRRVELFKSHRQALLNQAQLVTQGAKQGNVVTFSAKGRLSQTCNDFKVLSKLKPILLSQMEFTSDKVYKGHVLKAKIIEIPFRISSIASIIEDEEGNIERLCVYNFMTTDRIQDIRKIFYVGVKINIINPYHRMAMDGGAVIRVDDPKSIVFEKDSKPVCYYCGKEKTEGVTLMKCGQCRESEYCNRECQLSDWKILGHSTICKSLGVNC